MFDGNECVVDCSYCAEEIQAETCPNCDCTVAANMCEDGEVCCPTSNGADPSTGCVADPNIAQGAVCSCEVECTGDLTCVKSTMNTDGQTHCCPFGYKWTPNGCTRWVIYTMGVTISWSGDCYVYNLGGSCDAVRGTSDCYRNRADSVLDRVVNCFDDNLVDINTYFIGSGSSSCDSSTSSGFPGFWDKSGQVRRAYVENSNDVGNIPNVC